MIISFINVLFLWFWDHVPIECSSISLTNVPEPSIGICNVFRHLLMCSGIYFCMYLSVLHTCICEHVDGNCVYSLCECCWGSLLLLEAPKREIILCPTFCLTSPHNAINCTGKIDLELCVHQLGTSIAFAVEPHVQLRVQTPLDLEEGIWMVDVCYSRHRPTSWTTCLQPHHHTTIFNLLTFSSTHMLNLHLPFALTQLLQSCQPPSPLIILLCHPDTLGRPNPAFNPNHDPEPNRNHAQGLPGPCCLPPTGCATASCRPWG